MTRKQLVKYAGAAGDFNSIHWNGRVAHEVGLPDVIAHGMFTMASAAGSSPTGWATPAWSPSSRCASRAPWWSRRRHGATVEVTAVVGAVDADAGTARVDITAKFGGQTVLGKARATVALPA